jgi:deazaflavin-dependent oxidoreductase (nitroreductase family)
MNRVVEPSVRKGLGSTPFTPGTLIVLETTGHRTGRPTKVPLAALRVGEHVLVGTFRGRRSAWVKNLEKSPRVRYWLGGRARDGKAKVLKPDRVPRKSKDLSPAACALLPLLRPYTHAGWAFAFLTPDARTRERGAERRR